MNIFYNNCSSEMHSIFLSVATSIDCNSFQTLYFYYVQKFQTRREKKPKEERIDEYRPQGDEFDKAYTYDYKSRTDDTEISQKRVTSEKITVSGDIPRMEETEEPRYPKALDIGRIVIDEMPEEKQPVQKPDIRKRDKVKETRVDMELRDSVEQRQAPLVKQEVAKVGRLNITEYEKTPRESERPKLHQMVIYVSYNFCNTFL